MGQFASTTTSFYIMAPQHCMPCTESPAACSSSDPASHPCSSLWCRCRSLPAQASAAATEPSDTADCWWCESSAERGLGHPGLICTAYAQRCNNCKHAWLLYGLHADPTLLKLALAAGAVASPASHSCSCAHPPAPSGGRGESRSVARTIPHTQCSGQGQRAPQHPLLVVRSTRVKGDVG